MRLLTLTLAAVLSLAMADPPSADPPPAPVVVAVMGEPGINPFHTDLAYDGPLPPGLPDAVEIRLPDPAGLTFDEAIALAQDGPLGNVRPGTLYRIAGTRIIGVYRDGEPDGPTVDVLADREHGTGVLSSVVGAEHGTAPDAFVVYVADTSGEAWEWVAEQQWIDLVTVSTWEVLSGGAFSSNRALRELTCDEGPGVSGILQRGGMVFSLSGNHDQGSLYSSPPGLPGVYQVGGVDADGDTVLPPGDHPILPDPEEDPVEHAALLAPYSTHPYETGDRYDFDAADPDAFTGHDQFGGTSGATPSTAGRAATVISAAREIVGHRPQVGPVEGALAVGPNLGGGPLDDGLLTRGELAHLLHAVAVPSAPASPARYFVDGFGALNDDAVEHAIAVLRGERPMPDVHPDDQAAHDRTEEARAVTFGPQRCS